MLEVQKRSVKVNSTHACGRVSALSGDWRLEQCTSGTVILGEYNVITDRCYQTM